MGLALTLTLVFGAVAVFSGIGTYIYLRDRAKAKRESQELKERLERIEESVGQAVTYLDGLAETKGRKKIRLLNEALRAREEYRHTKAIAKFQEALPLASDDSERCAILNLIGISQVKSGANRDAKQTFLEMIETAQKPGLEEPLSFAFGNIGLVYRTLGEPQKAFEIDEKIGRLEGQAVDLGNIGNVYYTLGEPKKALGYLERSLKLAEQIGNPEVQANQLGNIGLVYKTLGEPNKALEYFDKSLEIHKKIGSLEGQAHHLGNIGLIYQTLGEPQKALEYYQKSLEIAKRIGNLEVQANQLGNIGALYGNLGDQKQALNYFQRAREIFVKIGAKLEIEKADQGIAIIRQKLAEQGK